MEGNPRRDLAASRGMEREGVPVLTDHRSRLIEYTDGYLEVLPSADFGASKDPKGCVFLSFFPILRDPWRQRTSLRRCVCGIRPGNFARPDLWCFFLPTILVARAVLARRRCGLRSCQRKRNPERDLIDKRSDYAEAKVPEYWIVNPQTETITVLELRGGAYAEAGVYRRGQSARSVLAPTSPVDVTAILGFGNCEIKLPQAISLQSSSFAG